MLEYVLGRVLWAVALFLGITLITFIEGAIVFATMAIVVFNLLVDVLYAWVDPRIRLTTGPET